MKKLFFLTAALFLLSGCSSTPASTDDGSKPADFNDYNGTVEDTTTTDAL